MTGAIRFVGRAGRRAPRRASWLRRFLHQPSHAHLFSHGQGTAAEKPGSRTSFSLPRRLLAAGMRGRHRRHVAPVEHECRYTLRDCYLSAVALQQVSSPSAASAAAVPDASLAAQIPPSPNRMPRWPTFGHVSRHPLRLTSCAISCSTAMVSAPKCAPSALLRRLSGIGRRSALANGSSIPRFDARYPALMELAAGTSASRG